MKPHAHKYQENITTELVNVRSTGKNFASHFDDRFKDYVGVCAYVYMCVHMHTHIYMYTCNIYSIYIVFIVM